MEPLFTWLDLLKLILLLVFGFMVLKFVSKNTNQFLSKTSFRRKLKNSLNDIVELYKPLSILLGLTAFVLIKPLIFGAMVLISAIVLFSYIKNYIHGVFFRINPLVEIGANLLSENYQGEIEKLLLFGAIIKVENGERFISYSNIEKQGFCINQKEDGSMRKTIYLLEPNKSKLVMDILFDNPMINFNQKPSIWKTPGESIEQLHLTLEKGAKVEALIDYLNQYNIKTSLTK